MGNQYRAKEVIIFTALAVFFFAKITGAQELSRNNLAQDIIPTVQVIMFGMKDVEQSVVIDKFSNTPAPGGPIPIPYPLGPMKPECEKNPFSANRVFTSCP